MIYMVLMTMWYLAIALSVFAAIIHLPIKEEPVLRLKTE